MAKNPGLKDGETFILGSLRIREFGDPELYGELSNIVPAARPARLKHLANLGLLWLGLQKSGQVSVSVTHAATTNKDQQQPTASASSSVSAEPADSLAPADSYKPNKRLGTDSF